MNYENFPGIYELLEIRSGPKGHEVDEPVQRSMFTFTPEKKLAVVSASIKMVMAYAGDYKIENDILLIAIKSSVFREMENTVIKRKILEYDGQKLMLEAIGSKSKERSVLTWKKSIQL